MTEHWQSEGRMMRLSGARFASSGVVAALTGGLIGIVLLVSVASGACAPEKMIFLAKVPRDWDWCGDRAVIVSSDNSAPIWLDVFGRRQVKLRLGSKLPIAMNACSPDGRWVVTQEDGSIPSDGGDFWCDPPDVIRIPTVVLWDTRSAKPYRIGTGFFDFEWSADGKMLLYRPWTLCDLDRDRRTRLRWPADVRAFRPLAATSLVAAALKGTPGWVDNGRISEARWIASDRIVAQIPDAESGPPTEIAGQARSGAIVLMHVDDGRVTRMEQLHPRSSGSGDVEGFRTTLTLNVPQVARTDSDDILRAAGCETGFDAMDCGPARAPRKFEYFRPSLERYCARLRADDGAFCRPTAATGRWERSTRGRTVLLLKPVPAEPGSGQRESGELFRVENDEGGYLK